MMLTFLLPSLLVPFSYGSGRTHSSLMSGSETTDTFFGQQDSPNRYDPPFETFFSDYELIQKSLINIQGAEHNIRANGDKYEITSHIAVDVSEDLLGQINSLPIGTRWGLLGGAVSVMITCVQR